MSTTSSNSELKHSSPKKESTKKLDFLLDTIDTEVANLADVVQVDGPILHEQSLGGEVSTVSLSDGATGMDSLELDMDLFGESDGPPPEDEPAANQEQAARRLDDGAIETDSLELDIDLFGESDEPSPEDEPADNQAQAALDAMSDAEDEVEAMLAKEKSTDAESSPATETSEEAVDDDISKALDELLDTREVDASKILEKQAVPKQKKELQKSPVVEEQLSEDLFDNVEKKFKSAEDEAAAKEANGDETEFSEDLFEELEMDLQIEEEATTAAEPVGVEEWIAKDQPGEAQLRREGERKDAGEAATKSGSEDELADLLTEKIEALVIRLVEERLSAIAERVIKEKMNKIFSSMK